MPSWSTTDQANSAPVYVTEVETGETGIQMYGNNVFGVDKAEAVVTGKGVAPGWVRVTTGSGGRAGRVTYETLVAFRNITGDGSDDTTFPDS